LFLSWKFILSLEIALEKSTMSNWWLAESERQDMISKLALSKSRHLDALILAQTLGEINGPGVVKTALLRCHALNSDCEGLVQTGLELFNEPQLLDLATTCILEAVPPQHWELLLRNRLYRLQRRRGLAFLDRLFDDPIDSSDDVTEGLALSLGFAEQLHIKAALQSEDVNAQLFALQRLLSSFPSSLLPSSSPPSPSSCIKTLRDICRTHVGPLFAALDLRNDDPLLGVLIFRLLIHMTGYDSDNGSGGARWTAIAAKLEEFAESWPVEASSIAALLLKQAPEDRLTPSVRQHLDALVIDLSRPLIGHSLYDLEPIYDTCTNQEEETENLFA
jgi:hypothetical protein